MKNIKPWMWIVLAVIVVIIIIAIAMKKSKPVQTASGYSYNPYQLNQLTRQVKPQFSSDVDADAYKYNN